MENRERFKFQPGDGTFLVAICFTHLKTFLTDWLRHGRSNSGGDSSKETSHRLPKTFEYVVKIRNIIG